jgi:hypothetical protein
MPQPAKQEKSAPEKSAEEQAKYQPRPSVQPTEPEDPRHAGQTAQRLALDKNPQGKHSQRHPEEAPGQHAIGSFTKDEEK